MTRVLDGISQVEAVFGFGSFFRDEPFNDIDVAVVFSDDCKDPLAVYRLLLSRLQNLEVGARLHVTPLTAKEFKTRPLLEHDRLVTLFSRE